MKLSLGKEDLMATITNRQVEEVLLKLHNNNKNHTNNIQVYC